MNDVASHIPARAKRSHLWQRDDLDWYVEPPRATELLLTVERFVGQVWDPACGQGNIVEVCRAAGIDAIGSDVIARIEPWPVWQMFCLDFLGDHKLSAANIVTNPPFFRAKGAEQFIRRALAITAGKICIFTDIRFLAGVERANGLFAEHPPHRIWIVTPRVSCPPGTYLAAGNKAGNGSSDYCWFVWDKTAPYGGTRLSWLRSTA